MVSLGCFLIFVHIKPKRILKYYFYFGSKGGIAFSWQDEKEKWYELRKKDIRSSAFPGSVHLGHELETPHPQKAQTEEDLVL